LAVGEDQKEAAFSLRKFAEGLKVFSAESEIKTVANTHFKLLVLLPSDKVRHWLSQKLAEFVKQKAAILGSNYAVSFIEEKDKYAAMCGSDFAVLHNGEVTVEAAACQLPALVINNMSNFKAYVSNLYNGHESPLNVSTNFEGYQ
jgi:lipid A disaccharide synthetase